MAEFEREIIFGKLNSLGYKGIESCLAPSRRFDAVGPRRRFGSLITFPILSFLLSFA